MPVLKQHLISAENDELIKLILTCYGNISALNSKTRDIYILNQRVVVPAIISTLQRSQLGSTLMQRAAWCISKFFETPATDSLKNHSGTLISALLETLGRAEQVNCLTSESMEATVSYILLSLTRFSTTKRRGGVPADRLDFLLKEKDDLVVTLTFLAEKSESYDRVTVRAIQLMSNFVWQSKGHYLDKMIEAGFLGLLPAELLDHGCKGVRSEAVAFIHRLLTECPE